MRILQDVIDDMLEFIPITESDFRTRLLAIKQSCAGCPIEIIEIQWVACHFIMISNIIMMSNVKILNEWQEKVLSIWKG